MAFRTFSSTPDSLNSMTNPGSPAMRPASYLVLGDLHGRVLPAFKLAQAWSREHGVALAGLLQVGDLGYFPDQGPAFAFFGHYHSTGRRVEGVFGATRVYH